MFSSKVKKFIATFLIFAMTVSSAGFTTLASTLNSAYRIAEANNDGRREEFSLRYSELYSKRISFLENTSDENKLPNEGDTPKSDGGEVQSKTDSSGDASVGAKNSSIDEDNKTTNDDSSTLNENKNENNNENKNENKTENKTEDENKKDGDATDNGSTTLDEQKEESKKKVSSTSDAEEEGGEENKSNQEEPEEDGQEKNKKSDDGNSEEETASTSETEKNDGGDADDETTATNSDVNEENNEFDLGEITMQLGDGNLLGANGDGADQYIDSYLWDKIKNCGATEIYFLNESEWNSAPGTVQALDSSRLWWREDSNAVRTETSLQAIAHPGSIDHGGTVIWEFDSTGHALKVKVDGTKYYFGPKQKVNFHVYHWGTYYGKWDANAFKSSFAINSGNATSVSYTGNAVYGLYAPSSASMKDFPNVKKMVLKELKLQDASGVGLFKDLTNLEELVLGSSIINNTNDFTNLFSGCTKLKSVTFPSSIGNYVTNLNFMFKDCAALQSVTFNNISLFGANVNATSMFEGCSTLKNINFGSVDLTKIADATDMFKNCTSLETIWVNAVSCRIKESAASSGMFQNCKSIKGYKGTTYDSSNINANYAHVDMDAWKGYFTTDDSVVNDATVDMKIIMQKTSGKQVERNIKALKAYTYSDFTSKYLNPIVAESGYEKILDYDKGFGKFICSDPNYSGDDIIVRFANVINNSKIDISDKTLGYNGYLTFLVYVNSSDITWILGSDVRWADGYVASKSYIRGKKFILPTDKDIIKEGYYLEGWLLSDNNGNHDEIITEFVSEEGDVKLVPEFRKGPKTLWFGTYPQNDATGAQQEPIKWRKINENGSEALYVADSVLDNVSFHSSDEGATWADSNMHSWLNDTFKGKAFTNNQIDEAIINKTINTSGSVDTTDKVFVLSYDEANNYFADNSERIAEATNYAKNVDNGGDKITVSDGKADWWLRTFGTSNGSINVVSSNGELDESGINPTYTKNGVRPALYLDLDSTLFRSYNNTITWNLGDELSWADSSTLWGEMTTYQGGQELPAQNNLATDRFLYGWKINDGQGIYKEIPENQTGNITLTPIFDTAPGTIWYGTYPQNDSTGKQIEPIKWRKLIENGGTEAVYVAENILDNVSYNKNNENTTWADSSIYSWLNDTSSAGFAGKAFTSNQLDNSLSIVKDKELVTSGSANINGKVNLLSLDDAQKLFKNDANRKASATAYAKAINNNGSVLTVNGGYSNWWLRSPGSEQMSNAAVIGFDGTINSNGSVVNASEIGVRPVLYVDITSETFKYDGNKVTWNLGSATWAAGSTLWGQMTNYQCGQALPKYNNLNIDKFLIGWKINNSTEVYKEIPNNQTGDITLTPVYGDAPDTLWLGLYPQNDVKGELLEPIKWRKLSQNGRSALYISDKVIDHVLYNDVNADVEWDTCTLHSWLNDSSATGFLGKTLTSIQFDDKTSILKPTELVTGQSIHTTDKVFLLKSDDVNNTNLFATKDDLKGKATEYTKAVKRNGKLIETSASGYARWWLRASYIYKNYSLYVTTNGTDVSGPAYYENTGLRPAINIDFESPLFRCTDNNLTWDLGDGMTWADRSTLWGEMTTYQGGQKLPTNDNLGVKYGYKLDGWFINGDRTATYSEIPSNQTGNITLTANWVAQNDENFTTYKIKWELGAGANWVDGYKPITSYVSGWKTSLPTNADVVKNHYVLEGWYINDDVIADTVIPSDQTGNITLKAKWTCDDYYVIPFKWYKNDLTGHEPMEVTAVHILRYPDIVPGPHGISASYEIEGSNGLMVYYTNTNEVYICAPQDKPIYTPEDGRYLFGAGRGSSTVNSRFSSVTTITGLDLLDTSKTKDMAGMFYYMAKLKSIDISSFDTFNVTSMKKMFYRDYELESINFGTIYTKNVTDMESMFEDNNKLKTLNLNGFNTQKLTSMDYMFRNCNELTTIYATKNFVTTAVTSTKTVFSGCSKLKGSNGTTYSAEHTDASYAWIDGLDGKPGYFYSDVNGEDCYILPRGWFSFDLAGRNPSQVKRIEITKSQTPQINADILKKWDIPGSGGLTAYYTIDNVVYIYATNDYPIYTAKDSTSLFYPGGGAADSPSEGTFKNLEVIKGLDLLDTSRTTNMTYMFMDLQKITSLDLSSFDTSNVTSMNKMFGQCYALESIDLSNFDTSNVTDMSAMFEGNKKLKVLDLRSFKTPNLTNMYSMFTSCEELTTIYASTDFVTNGLTSTNNVFYGCSKLKGSDGTTYSAEHTDASYAWIDGLDGKPGYFFSEGNDIGDSIFFGTYPQSVDDYSVVEPIKWKVLSSNAYEAILVSDKVLDARKYNDSDANISWGYSTIRSWLNTTFINKAWNQIEQAAIKSTQLKSKSSADTVDQVYLLSSNEADRYFANDPARKAFSTVFSKEGGTGSYYLPFDPNGGADYWLRDAGAYNNFAATVGGSGSNFTYGVKVDNNYTGIRPAIRIDLKSSLFTAATSSITWDIGDAEWVEDSTWKELNSYREGFTIQLPTKHNFKDAELLVIDGWYINGDRTVTYSEIPATQTGDITLTANWKVTTEPVDPTPDPANPKAPVNSVATVSHIEWELDGGDWAIGYTATTSYVEGEVFALPTNDDVVRDGYTLNGWYINNDGTATYSEIPSTQTGDITLTANWKVTTKPVDPTPDPVNPKAPVNSVATVSHIEWELDGGDWAIGYTATTSYVEGEVFALPTNDDVVRDGYTLNGWYINNDGTATYSEIPSTQTGDITLSANWLSNSVTSDDYYTFSREWVEVDNPPYYYPSAIDSEKFKVAKTISFRRYPDAPPTNASYNWVIKKGRGLQGYIVDDEIIIYAPENKKIYAENGWRLFSSYLIPSVEEPGADENLFKDVEKINNFGIVDTSRATSFERMFDGMESLKEIDLSKMDTSNVTDMSNMFIFTGFEKLDLSSFNTSKVVNMEYMFNTCEYLKELNLSSFDTSNVTNMFAMFGGCFELESLNLSNFNTENVINMASMFVRVKKMKTLNLSSFDTSKVTSMKRMFVEDDNLEDIIVDPAKWTTAQVTDISEMYKDCNKLTRLDLRMYDTSNVTNMTSMFEGCTNLSTIMVSNKFTVAKVTASENMFNGCQNLVGCDGTSYAEFGNRDASFAVIDEGEERRGYLSETSYILKKGWYTVADTSTQPFYVEKIRFASYSETITGYSATWTIDGGLKGYIKDTSTSPRRSEVIIKADDNARIYAPVDSSYLFSYLLDENGNKTELYGFNNVTSIENIEYLNTKKVATASHMFDNMGNLTTLDLSKNVWNNLKDTSYMFNDCEKMTTLNLGNSFKTSKVTNMKSMFEDCRALTALDVSGFDTASVTDMSRIFYNLYNIKALDVSGFDTAKVKDMLGMFYNLGHAPASTDIVDLDLSNFDTKNVTNMASMFGSAKVATINIANFDTSNVTSMSGMFANCGDLQSLVLGDNFITSNVTNMSHMFNGCYNLDYVDLSKFDTSKVTNMEGMFSNMNVANLDISGFDTSYVTNMSGMFMTTKGIKNLDFSNFNTIRVTDMSNMFMFNQDTETFDLDLFSFDTNNVTNMNLMFAYSPQISRIKASSKFVTTNVTQSSDMFADLVNLRGSLGTTLASTSNIADKTYARIDGGVSAPGYFSGEPFIITFDAGIGYFPSKSTGTERVTIATVSAYSGVLLNDIKPENPINNVGRSFTGWRYRNGPTTGTQLSFDNDITLDAVYEKSVANRLIVDTGVGKFANGDATRVAYMGEGADTGRLERPTAEGYVFDDYYVDGEVLTATWSYTSKDEVEVEAKYVPNNYKIIFNGNGATSGAMPMEIATYGETHILSKNKFENDGYDFAGWYFIDEDGQHDFVDGGEVFNLTSEKDGIVKLNAVWNPKSTKIIYDGNGATRLLNNSEWETLFGSGADGESKNAESALDQNNLFGREMHDEMDATQLSYNSQERLKPNRYYKPGYEFEGWALSPDTAAIYFDESEIGKDENYQEEITLYAKWKPKKEIVAKLVLDGNGGTINGAHQTEINLSYGEYMPQATIEYPGYELDYWEETYYLWGIIAIKARVKYPEVCNFSGTHKLVAHWKPIKYTLRLNENYGENKYYDIEATYGEEANITQYTVAMVGKRSDAKFSGWSVDRSAVQGPYLGAASAYPEDVKKGGIFNLYATWNKPRYSIKLHGIDPSRDLEADDNVYAQWYNYEENEKLHGIKYTVATINDVTSEFVGWTYDPYYANPDGKLYADGCVADRIYEDVIAKGVNFPLDVANVKMIELWPVWTNMLNSSYVIFDGNGGTIAGSKIKTYTYTAGKIIQAPEIKDLYRKGYEIDELNPWVDKNGNSFIDSIAKPEGEIHLYANWKQKTYDIEYVGIGEETILVSDPNANSVKETMQGGAKVTIPDNDKFERPGYDFLGWDTSVAADTVVYKAGQVVEALGDANETVKLYTVWQPRIYTIYYYDGDENLIGTNSFIFTRKVRALPNEGITDGNQDAGFDYEVNGEVKKFSSGQSLNAEDFEIVSVEKNVILNSIAKNSNANQGGLLGGAGNKLRDGASPLFGGSPLLGDSPLFGDPSTGGGIVLRGNTAKQIYNLTFDANGGQFPDGETVKTATASNGDEMAPKMPADPIPNPTNPDTTGGFIGWAMERDDGTLVEWTDSTYTLSESITFKAKWDTGFTARLFANGGTFLDGSTTQTVPMVRNESTSKFEIPRREGYDFVGYFVDSVHGEEILSDTWVYFANPITDVNAKWKPYNYKVQYDANSGVGYMGYEIATYNEPYKMADNKFTKDGYRFTGWDVNGTIVGEGIDQLNLTNVKNGTVVVKATWAPLTYDVEYYANTGVGNMPSERNLTYGVEHRLAPNAFTKTDYTFRGWALATDAEVAYYDRATLSTTARYQSVIKLYASWVDNNEIYGTLKLNGNTGSVNGSSYVEIPLSYHEAIVEPILEKTGYKFTNWTDKNGNIYDDGNGNNFPQICDFTELELAANWEPIKYSVRFFTNGGTFTDGTTDYKDKTDIEYDTQFNLFNTTDISKTRYTFGGWKYNGLSGEVIYAAGDPKSNLTTVDGDRINLYAVWTGDSYTITQHQLGPDGASLAANSVVNYTYGNGTLIANINKKIASVSGIDYEFAGWAVPSDRDTIKYFASQKADVVYETENVANIELYPVWVRKDNLVYITFDGNGGTVNGASRWTVPFATGSTLVYPTDVVRKGYVQNGWLDDDKTTPYAETLVGDDDKTIYANWNPGRYNIEYIAVGDNVDNIMGVQNDIPTNVKTTLNPNTYERLGYTFLGWDVNPDAKFAVYTDGETDLEPLGDDGETIKLYTVWKANDYTITYKDFAGTVFGTDTLTYGNTVTLIANSNIPTGYKDTGFELEGHPGVKFSGGQTVDATDLMITKTTDLNNGIVLNGTVEKIVYIITFNANGGTFPDGRTIASSSITYGDPVAPTVPGNPTHSVKTFTGYTVDGAYRDVTTLTYDYLSSKTFLADWDGTLYKIEYKKNAPVSPDPAKTNIVTGATMATQSALANRPTRINSNLYNIVGYNFIGWATASYTAKVAEQMKVNNDPRIIGNAKEVNWDKAEGDVVTLYAMWGRNKYQVTFVQNEAAGSVPDPYVGASSFDLYYDELLSDNAAFAPKTRNHYTFSGKFIRTKIAEPYARKTFNGTDYFTTSSVYRLTSGITLYPLWWNDEVVINLDIDPDEAVMPAGYTNTTFIGYVDAPLKTKGAAGEPKTAEGLLVTPIATPYEVYKFNYWSRVKGDPTTKINEAEIYDGSYNTIYANVRLREEYALTYDPNGGKGYMASKTMKEGIKIKTDDNQFTKDGYNFNGWMDQFGNLHGNGFTVDNPTKPLALKAQWSKPLRGGNGPSGGGGGGGAGIQSGSKQTDLGDGFSLQTMVPVTDYVFTRDSLGLPTGVLLKTSSQLAKSLMSNRDFNSRYKVIEGNNDAVILKNGFYNLQRPDGNFYYAFDAEGKLLTGFVSVDPLLLHSIDNEGKLVKIGEAEGGKYYLLDDTSANRGILYAAPITVNGIKYLFDETGRVAQELKDDTANTALLSNQADTTEFKNEQGWKYDPVNDNWSYYIVGSDGKVNPYINGVYAIEAPNRNTYYYIFDEKGVMKTGITRYNGKTYYLRESGDLRGSVYTGSITLNNTNYMFDDSGVMVTTADTEVVALTKTEPVENGENRFIP